MAGVRRFRHKRLVSLLSHGALPGPRAEEFEVIGEAPRPEDGALIGRWFRCAYHLPNRLQFSEGPYEAIRDGQLIQPEHHAKSPALRCFPASEACCCSSEGFTPVHTRLHVDAGNRRGHELLCGLQATVNT